METQFALNGTDAKKKKKRKKYCMNFLLSW